jgi:hypothetical protein
MNVSEIEKHIEEVVEPKAGEASARAERIAAQQLMGVWEAALQLAKIYEEIAKLPR